MPTPTRKPYRGRDGTNPRTYVSREFARGLLYSELYAAEERGRRAAAIAMASDPEARIRVESAFGLAYAHSRYPEVYAN